MRGGRFAVLAVLVPLVALPPLAAFSRDDVISPAEGVWGNVQALVLDTSDNSELYYSLTGSDPMVSGFAYDGPVVIDETGPVVVNITAVSPGGGRSDVSIRYTVSPDAYRGDSLEASLFVRSIMQNPIRKYVSGSAFTIPAGLSYRMSHSATPLLPGASLSLSAANLLDRYLPCIVTDGSASWHFVIHTVAARAVQPPSGGVPFRLEDWETFVFTDGGFIYQIDDGYWAAGAAPVAIDRSVEHVVRWQPLAYAEGNPVRSCMIPPRPTLGRRMSEDGAANFFVPEGDYGGTPYLLGRAAQTSAAGSISPGAYSEVPVDIFFGDRLSGTLSFGVYYGGVYQGSISYEVHLDRQPPAPPQIATTARAGFARGKVVLSISAEEDAAVFYAVSRPLESDVGFEDRDSAEFDDVDPGPFSLYGGGAVELSSLDGSAAFYKVCAYAVDDAGNTSPVTEYRVVVDEHNYYLGSTALRPAVSGAESPLAPPDGSYARPFQTFEQAVAAINATDYTRLHISGTVRVAAGEQVITSDCMLIGNQSSLQLEDGARIRVEEADVEVQGCVIRAEGGGHSLFAVSGGGLHFKDCEVVGIFGGEGILLDGVDSALTFENTGVTVQGDTYACAVSAFNSAVRASGSRITSVAPNCVNFSINGGSLELRSSSGSVIGRLGRSVELVQTTAALSGNSFTARLSSGARQSGAVWKDVDSVVTLDRDNREEGF